MLYWAHEKIPWENLKCDEYVKRENKDTIQYYNLACAFDIETSSFYENDEYRACMYCWQMCFGDSDIIIFGRTWEEFHNIINQIIEFFALSKNHRLVFYVHNLAYEFAFIRAHFEWMKVFSIQSRRPIYAVTTRGIEFRCSYLLSGLSLEKTAQNLLNHKIAKLVGDLDYNLVRHSKTPITTRELLYCIYDVKIVCAYITERIEADGNITKIPLTKTGYVRNDCRQALMGTNHKSKDYQKYHAFMKMLSLRTDEYHMLKRAFQGGFTHANAWHVEEINTDVESRDFTSSYPTVMIAEQFPMSYGEKIHPTLDEFLQDKDIYCYLLDVEFKNIQAKITYEHYISKSKCWELSSVHDVDNGRIVSANRLCITITEVDFDIIDKVYKWDEIEIKGGYRYKKGYLPTKLVERILFYYGQKTTLKDVIGKEAEYLSGKEKINSVYGMCVQDAIQDLIEYDSNTLGWYNEPREVDQAISKYNSNYRRFLFYPWGVWVTAYARCNLWTGIFECKHDYIYSDTDSIKCINIDQHMDYFNKYNEWITKKLNNALDYHNLDRELLAPKTIKGKTKPLGIWDFDGKYSRFKTLGAKRYMTDNADTGEISLTVSGLNKKKAVPYLLKKYGQDKIFDAFKASTPKEQGLYIPPEHSGRLIMSYVDYETKGQVKDYTGQIGNYHELTSVHSEAGTYEINYGKEFINYLLGLREVVIK